MQYIHEHHILSSISRSCRFGIKFLVQISFKSLFVALQVDVKRSMDDGEKRFNQLSIEERGIWLIFYGFLPPKIRLFPVVSIAKKIRKLSEISL
jgi:hypothetical protein